MEIDDDLQDLLPTEEDIFGEVAEDLRPIEALPDNEEDGAIDEVETVSKTKKNITTTLCLSDKLVCTKTGVGALLKMFEGVKFTGDGKESDNLDLLMNRYELWAHRMFPRYPFEDVVEGVEELGGSRKIKCHLSMIMKGEDSEGPEISNDSNAEKNLNSNENGATVDETGMD